MTGSWCAGNQDPPPPNQRSNIPLLRVLAGKKSVVLLFGQTPYFHFSPIASCNVGVFILRRPILISLHSQSVTNCSATTSTLCNRQEWSTFAKYWCSELIMQVCMKQLKKLVWWAGMNRRLRYSRQWTEYQEARRHSLCLTSGMRDCSSMFVS